MSGNLCPAGIDAGVWASLPEEAKLEFLGNLDTTPSKPTLAGPLTAESPTTPQTGTATTPSSVTSSEKKEIKTFTREKLETIMTGEKFKKKFIKQKCAEVSTNFC
jgi:hypothetical protein